MITPQKIILMIMIMIMIMIMMMMMMTIIMISNKGHKVQTQHIYIYQYFARTNSLHSVLYKYYQIGSSIMKFNSLKRSDVKN